MEKEWLNPFHKVRTSLFFILLLIGIFLVLVYQLINIISEPYNPRPLQPFVLKSEIKDLSNASLPKVNIIQNDQEILAEDLVKMPCGYYYEKYGICSGKCKKGYCEYDNKGCYCNIDK